MVTAVSEVRRITEWGTDLISGGQEDELSYCNTKMDMKLILEERTLLGDICIDERIKIIII
jgi:hypothetical protein